MRKRLDRPFVIVEVSYPFTLRDAGDKTPNLLGEDSLHRGYPATMRGQQRFMNDIVGVVYWEPARVSTRCPTRWGTGSYRENATLFDFRSGNDLTPAADFLNTIRGIQ